MRLGGLLRPRLSFVAQMTASECSVACLAMVLAQHRCHVDKRALRSALGTGRDGASAHALFTAARSFGLDGRAVRVRGAKLGRLCPGTILHWERRHFVVLERVTRRHIWILDPAVGRRRLTRDEVAASFSGLALELSPDPHDPRWSGATPRRSSPSWKLVREATVRARMLLPFAAATLVSICVGLGVAAVLHGFVAQALSPHPRFLRLAVGVGLVVLATMVAHRLRAWATSALGMAIEGRLFDALQRQLLAVPTAFYRLRTTEDLVDRLARVQILRTQLTRAVAIVAIDAPTLLVYLAVVSTWASSMAWTAVGLAVLHRAIATPLRRAQSRAQVSGRGARSRLDAFEARAVRGMDAIKAMGGEAGIARRWSALRTEADQREVQHGRARVVATGVVEGFGLMLPVVLLAVGAYEVSAGSISVAALVATHWLAVAALRPLGSMLDASALVDPTRRAIERLDDVLDEIPAGSTSAPSSALMLPAAIELDAVSVPSASTDEPALDGATVTLPPVRHIAVVGPPGRGTATLAAALVGVTRPEHGRVCIGGLDLARHGVGPRTHPLSLVPPSVPLFNGTIRDNIALGADGSTEYEVLAAARLAGIDTIVAGMPQGYETAVFDDGRGLADGLKRRIGIARALVGRPQLLVIDEAASALGPEAEGALVDGLLSGSVRTLVTVNSHRSTVQRAGLVVVVEAGRVVEAGPPQGVGAPISTEPRWSGSCRAVGT
ncbi:MAG: ATP-binding cassette domain-containing protein [Deltaproteobacteria bacterium]|nr:ATP-binding cassette domain-containing protein [Deltaproteobacteria bacterium]